jgi:hypothetical protein
LWLYMLKGSDNSRIITAFEHVNYSVPSVVCGCRREHSAAMHRQKIMLRTG